MKIFISISLICALCVSYAYSQNNFRNTHWGMTLDQVKKVESAALVNEEDGNLLYNSKVAGLETYIGYVFAKDKLVRTAYLFSETHSNQNDYIDDFNNLKSFLTTKYGDPYRDKVLWKNELYKNDVSQWGFAISLGHLIYTARWEDDDTQIMLSLYGENYELNTILQYRSKELSHLEEDAKKESILKDF